jgi:hypothetical protein
LEGTGKRAWVSKAAIPITIVAESNKATAPSFIPTKSVPLKAKFSKRKSRNVSRPAVAVAPGGGTRLCGSKELVL